jgi:hypothetical protein
VLEQRGAELSIRVRHPRYSGSTVGAILTALPVAAIFGGIFGSMFLNAHSLGSLAILILLAWLLGLLLFLFVRSVFEEQTGEQFVHVEGGSVHWGWQTKWWKRERVDLFTRRYRFKILERVLAEDATRFAAELKRAVIYRR